MAQFLFHAERPYEHGSVTSNRENCRGLGRRRIPQSLTPAEGVTEDEELVQAGDEGRVDLPGDASEVRLRRAATHGPAGRDVGSRSRVDVANRSIERVTVDACWHGAPRGLGRRRQVPTAASALLYVVMTSNLWRAEHLCANVHTTVIHQDVD